MKKLAGRISIILLLLIPGLAGAREKEQQSFEEKYKDESSILLVYDTSIELKEDYSCITKVHKKLEILKECAKSLGDVAISYDKGRERITDISAFTITPDGKKHKSKIQDIKPYEGFAMYSDTREKVITFPNVNVGSILEYRVTIVSDKPVIKNAFWTDFYFDTSPVKKLHYSFTFPKKFNMHYVEFNLDYKPAITEDEFTKIYSWDLENMDKQDENDESYLPPISVDSITNGIEFSTIKKWSDVSDWYYASIQKNLVINEQIKAAAEQIFKDHTGIRDKTRAVLEYIQDNFRYVSMSFGANRLEPHSTDEVFKNKYGDCKDLSLLCLTLLKLGGIKSNLALFANEYDISAPQYDPPFPTLFDHVLVLVKDPAGSFYIDPLLKGYDIGQYPYSYQRAYTFVINGTGGSFKRFPVFDEKRDYIKKESTITLKNDGSAIIEYNNLWDLDTSIEARTQIKAMSKEEKEKFFKYLHAQHAPEKNMLEHSYKGMDAKYGQVSSHVKFNEPGAYPIIDGIIVIDISGYGKNSDFIEQERKHPIFYNINSLEEDKTIYNIPDGFRASHIPDDLDMNIGFFHIRRKYKYKDNQIIINETTRYKRMELPKEEYNKVKDFFDNLPEKSRQRIIVKKIKPFWQEIREVFKRLRNR